MATIYIKLDRDAFELARITHYLGTQGYPFPNFEDARAYDSLSVLAALMGTLPKVWKAEVDDDAAMALRLAFDTVMTGEGFDRMVAAEDRAEQKRLATVHQWQEETLSVRASE